MPPSYILHASTAHYWSCLSCSFFPMIPLYKLPYSIKIVTKIKILVAKFKLKYYFTNKYAYMLRRSKKPKKWLPRPFGKSLSSFLHKRSASLQKMLEPVFMTTKQLTSGISHQISSLKSHIDFTVILEKKKNSIKGNFQGVFAKWLFIIMLIEKDIDGQNQF